MQRGMSMHFFPSGTGPGDYTVMVYRDEWENGTCARTEGFCRQVVEIDDIEWLTAMPVSQFVTLALELCSQLVTIDVPEELSQQLRESVAKAVREKGIAIYEP